MPIHMRLPKLKGFRNRFRTEYEVVNVGDINRLFPKGGDVGVDELVATGAVRKNTWSRCSATASWPSRSTSPRTSSAAARARRSPPQADPPPSCDAVLDKSPRHGGGSCVQRLGNVRPLSEAIYTSRVDTSRSEP